MTTARLSPSAALLRGSRLFALPRSIPGPIPKPSSKEVTFSDTASTPWPLQAAIETPALSQDRGDWGLKRPLPSKSTNRGKAKVIRVQNGLETSDHVTDFETAHNHVAALLKFQELGLSVKMPKTSSYSDSEPSHINAFSSRRDNVTLSEEGAGVSSSATSNVWPHIGSRDLDTLLPDSLREEAQKARARGISKQEAEEERMREDQELAPTLPLRQEPHRAFRWRHEGPWLAGMTEDQFQDWLGVKLRIRKPEFRALIQEHMRAERKTAAKAQALQEGTSFNEDGFDAELTLTDEDVMDYLRALRSKPDVFGPLIANFFDLPEGPLKHNSSGVWPYGRETVSADIYRQSGPPKGHPSAGLSYARSDSFADNDAEFGPQNDRTTVVGRVLKSKTRDNRYNQERSIGVAGFVGNYALLEGARMGSNGARAVEEGGPKVAVRPVAAAVKPDGYVALKYADDPYYRVAGNTVKRPSQLADPPAARQAYYDRTVPQLDRSGSSDKLSDRVGLGERMREFSSRQILNQQTEIKSASAALLDQMTKKYR